MSVTINQMRIPQVSQLGIKATRSVGLEIILVFGIIVSTVGVTSSQGEL